MSLVKSRAPLRVGIIGAGWPAERHTEGYQKTGEVEVVAVCDLDDGRREAFAKRYSVPRTYREYHELLRQSDIEAVSVTLPNFLHRPATIAALEIGKHVLCEKPPALTVAEAEQMGEVAERKGLLLAYALQRRFMLATEALRSKIAEGVLGDVYHARAVWTRTWGVPQGMGGWFTDPNRAGGGALIDIGVHVLDVAWFLMGCPKPITVSGQVHNGYPDLTRTEDSAFALIRFEDGRSIHLEASWVLAQESDHMGVHLYGTRGGARVDDGSIDTYTVGPTGRVKTSVSFGNWMSGFEGQAQNFVRAVRGIEPLRTPAMQGIQIMSMLEGIYRSSTASREVAL